MLHRPIALAVLACALLISRASFGDVVVRADDCVDTLQVVDGLRLIMAEHGVARDEVVIEVGSRTREGEDSVAVLITARTMAASPRDAGRTPGSTISVCNACYRLQALRTG